MPQESLYIGLMSGTSADGIDAVLVDFSDLQPQILASHSQPLNEFQAKIHQICSPGEDEISRLGELDRTIGEQFAEAVLALLAKSNFTSSQIAAIGSHGQTIRHLPPTEGRPGFTLQIGDPNIIAERTGITTVADLRRRDMAAGGQGAPIVPAFHQAVFEKPGCRRVIVNIGGLANITVLPGDGQIFGYDTGPGNTLMDAWCFKQLKQTFDANGAWAACGTVNQVLLAALLDTTPYFKMPPPKSTGRELFNLPWLETFLQRVSLPIAPEDIQATLLELTAQSIANEVCKQLPEQVYICGGGAFNDRLMTRLKILLAPTPVESTAKLGISPQFIEAAAFAWLARQTLNHLPGNAPYATGAMRPVILGGIYLGC